MYLGVDIGGTSVKYGLFDDNLNLVDKKEVTSNKGMSLLDDIIAEIKNRYKSNNLKAIGLGLAGFVLENGYVDNAINLLIKDMNIIDYFYDALAIPTFVLNDANAAAYGELKALKQNNVNAIMLTIGTGVGAGIVHNKKLLIGSQGAAGEIGHMLVDCEFLFQCNCGNKGCLETVASASGFVNLYNYYKSDYADSITDITCKQIFEMAKQGNELCAKVVDVGVDYLALAIYNAITLLNPDVIIIGGGVSRAKQYLLNIIETKVNALAIPVFSETQIVLATLENDAGIYGLAHYVYDMLSEN